MSDDLLIDTHVAIWLLEDDPRWRPLLEDVLEDDASTLTVSVATWLEIAIKFSQGKLPYDVHTVRAGLIDNGFLELPIITGHARALEQLPTHHRDPFDRIMLAQAASEGMSLVTMDGQLGAYRDIVRLRGV